MTWGGFLIVHVATTVGRVPIGGAYGVTGLTVIPREHRPKAAREVLSKHRFRLHLHKYLQFQLSPVPFCMLLSRLKPGRKESLGVLDRTFLRGVGSRYILCEFK